MKTFQIEAPDFVTISNDNYKLSLRSSQMDNWFKESNHPNLITSLYSKSDPSQQLYSSILFYQEIDDSANFFALKYDIDGNLSSMTYDEIQAVHKAIEFGEEVYRLSKEMSINYMKQMDTENVLTEEDYENMNPLHDLIG